MLYAMSYECCCFNTNWPCDRVRQRQRETLLIFQPQCQSNDRKCLLSSPFGEIRRMRAGIMLWICINPCSTRNSTILNQLNAFLCLWKSHAQAPSLMGEREPLGVWILQFSSIDFRFTYPTIQHYFLVASSASVSHYVRQSWSGAASVPATMHTVSIYFLR